MSELTYNKRRFYLIPLFFIIHNIEEIFLTKRWNLYYEITGIDYTAFSMAVLLISIIVVFAFRFSEKYKNGYYFYNLAVGLLTAMMINTFVPHIAASIYYKGIAPGLISSVVLILPLGFYIFAKDVKPVIKRKEVILSMIIVPIVLLIVTGLLLWGCHALFNNVIYPDHYNASAY